MKIIQTLRLKLYLEECGHKCLGTLPHKTIPGYLVFCFDKSEELESDIKYYLDNKLYKKY